jgi:DNA-binding MarR family transcriptional regulator
VTDSNIDNALENLMAIFQLLHKTIVRPLRSSCSISPGMVYILGQLKKNGTLSMSEIGKKLIIPKPNVTTLVDKLIAESLAERLPDENDRRIINIRLTEKGSEVFLVLKKNMSEELQRKIEVLNEKDIEELSHSSAHVKDMLRLVLNADCKHC